jgi:ParB-like chromosome segregation protein Spo0J
MEKLQISKEFKSLIPHLSEGVFNLLEQNILKEGIRDPIVVYNNIIIDGHNRYKIAQKHNLKFKTVDREFNSIDEVKIWILENQAGRRNLNESQRALLGAKLSKTEIGSNQYTKEGTQGCVPSSQSEAARVVNVSQRSISSAKKILVNANPEIIKAIELGKLSLYAAEKEINKTKTNNVEKVKKAKQKDIVENTTKDYTLIQIKTPPELHNLIVKHMQSSKISDKGEGVVDFIRNLLNTVDSITEFLAKKL